MKIAMPVNDKTMDSTVCLSFGRTPFFLIHDTETLENKFLDNGAAAAQGGAGIKAAQTIVDNGVSALLTPRCGDNAALVFKAANVKLYKTVGDSIADNIKAFNEGKLSLLTDIHAGFHTGHGGN